MQVKIFSLFYFLPVKYRKCKCLIIFRACEEVEKYTVSNTVGATIWRKIWQNLLKLKMHIPTDIDHIARN